MIVTGTRTAFGAFLFLAFSVSFSPARAQCGGNAADEAALRIATQPTTTARIPPFLV